MSISSEYRKIVLERIIRDLLASGESPSLEEVESAFNAYLAEHDISKPQFNDEDFDVTPRTSSSASLYNSTNQAIKEDIQVLFTNALMLSNDSAKFFDRTRSELQRLEGQLDRLNDRITSALLVIRDTAGFFNFVSDTFSDTEKIDVPNSSVVVDLGRNQVTLGPVDQGTTRVLLNNIDSEDAEFIVLTRKNLQSVVEAEGGGVENAFHDTDRFWQHRVYMSSPAPVVGELKVRLADEPVSFSRIYLKLHAANTNSSMQITPLVSTDGINYAQLNTNAFSLSATRTATFTFPVTEATHVKFIFSKEGFDTVDGLNYVYEFGCDDIAFYAESFEENTPSVLFTTPLSIVDQTGNLDVFTKASLEVCEFVPEGTTIDYFVAATDTNDDDPNDLNWVQIDPVDRDAPTNPTVVDFTDLEDVEVGNSTESSDWIKVSYDATNADEDLINPGPSFNIVTDTVPTVTPATTSGIRFALPSNSDRILDHQISTDIDIQEDRLVVLRNLGLKGNTTKVRGVQSGWGFEDPYYSTTIEIKNKAGVDIDFGDQGVIIDGIQLQGNVHIDPGLHLVRTHKDNWVEVGDLNDETVAGLQAIDPLYPFNHKLLIEGYSYPVDFEGGQIYVGVDVFAEIKMVQVSPFDLLRNVSPDDYSRFAIDLDAKDGARDPSRVIIVKTDTTNPDFINERFVIRMKANTSSLSFNYIWLRADLSTTDEGLAPILGSYRIKLGK